MLFLHCFVAPQSNPQGIPPNSLPAATIEFKFDGLSRLVERKVTRGIDPPEVEGYQWDGWKLIMIAKLNSNGTYHSRKWSCVWRPDIGSSLYARSDWMRAGGVGGLAWLQTGAVQSYSYGTGSAEVHVPLADHMGNVRHYYQFKASGKTVTGQLVASYEYDAFGREVRAWGLNTPTENQPPGLPASRPWADLLPFHYSSKLRDADSGFNYYGYRFYDPGAGRWLNRDPIGEEGGVNLYGMVGNDAVNQWDNLGLVGSVGIMPNGNGGYMPMYPPISPEPGPTPPPALLKPPTSTLPVAGYRPIKEGPNWGRFSFMWHAFVYFPDGSSNSNTGRETPPYDPSTDFRPAEREATGNLPDGTPCSLVTDSQISDCVRATLTNPVDNWATSDSLAA